MCLCTCAPPARGPTSHGRTGVPHAIRAIRVSDLPRLCGPAPKNRRAARNPGDPGCSSAAFLRSGGQDSARRTQSGGPGFRICRVFTVRRSKIGVPHAIRVPRVSDLSCFHGPAATNRRAARNPGDPGLRSAAFLRSGDHKSTCRMESGRSGSRGSWPGPPAEPRDGSGPRQVSRAGGRAAR